MRNPLNPNAEPFEQEGRLHDPGTISLAMLGMSAVSTVSGLVQGVSGQAKNKKIEGQQQADFEAAKNMALQFAAGVKKENYDQLADVDIRRAMEGVSEIMSTRGLGLGSSAMASTLAGAAGEIRGAYGKQYLQDKQAATSQAVSTLAGVAGAPRLGYQDDPWAGFASGVGSLGDWAANNRKGLGVDPVTGLRTGQQILPKP